MDRDVSEVDMTVFLIGAIMGCLFMCIMQVEPPRRTSSRRTGLPLLDVMAALCPHVK